MTVISMFVYFIQTLQRNCLFVSMLKEPLVHCTLMVSVFHHCAFLPARLPRFLLAVNIVQHSKILGLMSTKLCSKTADA